ncbi:MAG TPA: PilW family protein [Steroidobacteraceae bacterium]
MTAAVADTRFRALGVSLIELLVAITIGGILIFGATQVYVDSRKTYEVNETVARLQETARYAMSVIEPDIRMSNYWGLVKGAGVITDSAPAPTTDESKCGATFTRDLLANIAGSNNSYGFSCSPITLHSGGNGAVATADTLIVRRAAVAARSAGVGQLQICSTRIAGELVTDSTSCTSPPEGEIHNLIVHGYYVHRDSVQAPNVPSLRRLTLVDGPDIRDVEVISGVEDMQVEFGINTAGTNGEAERYVAPGAVPAGAQVVSVRVWLLIRAETPEVGFIDGRTYRYGDRTGSGTTSNLNDPAGAGRPYAPNDNFRRVLVSRTIQIRNALGT